MASHDKNTYQTSRVGVKIRKTLLATFAPNATINNTTRMS